MIAIQKKSEPEGLAQLRQKAIDEELSPKEAYALLRNPLKEQVRDRPVEEQGKICAYCMCRIPRQDADPVITPIILEHMVPRSPGDGRNIGQGLDYHNFVAVCHGNRGAHGSRTMSDLTCDGHKGNDEFRKVNPCRPETLTSITYTIDGKIDAADPDVRFDLIHTLNLNCPSSPLIAERKAALESLIDEMGQVSDDDLVVYCSGVLKDFQAETNPRTPYVGILVWYLQSMISAMDNSGLYSELRGAE